MHKRLLNTFLLVMVITSITSNAQQQSGNISATTVGTLTKINPEKKMKEEDLPSKEVEKQVAVPNNADIFIETNSHNVIVKTWALQYVKITTTVYSENALKATNDELLEQAGITMKVAGSSVKIKTVYANSYAFNGFQGAYTTANNNYGMSLGNVQGNSFSNSSKKKITITVPASSKLDIESRYADISLPVNISEATIDITNGNFDAENINTLNLRAKYASINMGDIKNAEIELTNGRFNAKNINDLDIETKYSSVDMIVVNKIIIRSTNDEYEIEEVGDMNGRKNYGNLRITKLLKTINLEGANADVKIRSLAPTVSVIKIDNKYADIRIPLKSVKNYQVDFTGYYSSVYGNFEKQALALSEKEMQTLKPVITSVGKLNNLKALDRAPSITSLGTLTNITVTGVIRDASGKLVSAENSKPANITTGTLTSVAPAYVFSGSLSENNAGLTALTTTRSMTVTGRITPAVSSIVPNTVSGSLASSEGVIEGGTIKGVLSAGTIPGIYGMTNGGTLYATSRPNYSNDNDTPTKFTATVGDGKGLKIDMKCLNCTVDFK